MGWSEFALSLAVFFLLHAVPVRPPVKTRIVSLTGPRGFSVLYSIVSLLALSWLIIAAGRAPVIQLWPLTEVTRTFALGMMALASLVFSLAIGRPNPLSFGGSRNERFDPRAPGIVGWTRHPLLAAIGLWALAHLVANGDLAHAILFGLFLGFSILGMRLIDRRKQRALGEDWFTLSATKREVRLTRGGVIRVGVSAALYVLLIWLHRPVIGVMPLG